MRSPDTPPLDLSECDREPIHIPGSIQPHGVLLAVTEPQLQVVQVSANTGELLGRPPGEVLGRALEDTLGREGTEAVRRCLSLTSFRRVNPLPVEVEGRPFEALLHRSDGLLLLELEPPTSLAGHAPAEEVRDAIFRMQEAATVAELLEVAAEEMRRLTGFDRVMVYRFDPDWHGHVVAEARNADVMDSFLGLHFPASDIPVQARQLYTLNWLRLIRDASYTPAPLVPRDNPLTGRPLDLSRSTLRSVSPVHCQYLRNMGVVASMSVSLVRDEQLWGLIACHHASPRWLPARVRQACEFIGEGLSWLLAAKERADETVDRLRASRTQSLLTARMTEEADLADALTQGEPSLLDLVEAEGAAVLHEGACTLVGRTPPREEVEALAAWLREHTEEIHWVTDALSTVYPGGERLREVASGVLAVAVSRAHGNFLLWFRPEVVQTVSWGGNPHQAAKGGSNGQLHPRASFAQWKEVVRGRSRPWRRWEVEAADALRQVIVGQVLSKAAELAQLNVDLRAAVQTRDDFLSMASHELRTPLTSLQLHLQGLLRTARRQETLPSALVVTRMEGFAKQLARLERLIASLMDVSRITAGRLSLELEEVHLPALVREVLDRLQEQVQASGSEVTLEVDPMPPGRWDRLRLDQVLTNLLTNALKYGAGRPVRVEVRASPEGVRCAVHDQGIGISPEAQARLFQRFERAVSSSHYSGFGLGLWIVRQVLEALGGRIALESTPGRGSTFTFFLPWSSAAARAKDPEAPAPAAP